MRKRFQDTAVLVLGGEPRQYGLHSLRAGAATMRVNARITCRTFEPHALTCLTVHGSVTCVMRPTPTSDHQVAYLSLRLRRLNHDAVQGHLLLAD